MHVGEYVRNTLPIKVRGKIPISTVFLGRYSLWRNVFSFCVPIPKYKQHQEGNGKMKKAYGKIIASFKVGVGDPGECGEGECGDVPGPPLIGSDFLIAFMVKWAERPSTWHSAASRGSRMFAGGFNWSCRAGFRHSPAPAGSRADCCAADRSGLGLQWLCRVFQQQHASPPWPRVQVGMKGRASWRIIIES